MAATAQLLAKLALDSSNFSSGLKNAQNGAKKFASTMRTVFASIGLGAAVRSAAKDMEFLARRSQALGVSSKFLQQLSRAARVYGTNIEELADGMHDLGERSEKAIESNNEYRKAFEDLNIDVREFIGMPLEERFLRVSKAISESSDSAKSLQAGMAIFSDQVVKFLPMMRDYNGMIAEMGKAAIVSEGELASMLQTQIAINAATEEMDRRFQKAIGSLAGLMVFAGDFFSVLGDSRSFGDAFEQALIKTQERTEALTRSMHGLTDATKEYGEEKKKQAKRDGDGLTDRERQIKENERALFSIFKRTSLMTPEHRTLGASPFGPMRDLEQLARISNHLGGGRFAAAQGAKMEQIREATGNPFDVITSSNGSFRFRSQGLTTGGLGDAPRRVGRSADLRELARERRDANRPSSEATAQKMLEKLGSIDRSIKEQSDTNF